MNTYKTNKLLPIPIFSLIILIAGLTPFFSPSLSAAREIKRIIKVPEAYIVKEGDNLWELSKKWYKDPYQWRSIWEKNLFINNPNLIYPGDPLFLPDKFMNKEVVEIIPDEEKKEILRPETTLPSPLPDPIPIVSDSVYFKSGYITSEKNWVGRIISGPAERTIFGERDNLYVDIGVNNVSLGDTFIIINKLRDIRHPVTGKWVGTLIQEVGILEITEIREDNSTSLVIISYSDIEVGDLLVNIEDPVMARKDLLLEKKEKEIKGYIITGKEERDTYGRGSIIYLDVGKSQGVTIGDRFVAYKRGKTIGGRGLFNSGKQINLPITILGEIEVFNIRKDTSTAVLRDSKKELSIGASIKYIKK